MEEVFAKDELDDVIQYDIDKVVCIRFGIASQTETALLDDTVRIVEKFLVSEYKTSTGFHN